MRGARPDLRPYGGLVLGQDVLTIRRLQLPRLPYGRVRVARAALEAMLKDDPEGTDPEP